MSPPPPGRRESISRPTSFSSVQCTGCTPNVRGPPAEPRLAPHGPPSDWSRDSTSHAEVCNLPSQCAAVAMLRSLSADTVSALVICWRK